MSRELIDVGTIYREIYVEPGSLAEKIAREYGYLPYMIQRYLSILGVGETLELLKAFEKPLKPVVRTNDLLVSPEKLYNRLIELGFMIKEIEWAPGSFRVLEEPATPSIGATHEYLKGYYYVHRDAASLIPSIILLHSYRGTVLDTCAAPGGKTTHIAQLLRNDHLVIANDLVLYRLKALISHVMRMKFRNVSITWSDARKLPHLLNKRFKRVLLDAPCSGEGTIMFDQSRKTKTSLRDLAIMVKREIELLYSGLEMLENDGLLAYVTCSIAPEENEYVVSKILELRNDVEVVELPIKLFNWSNGVTHYGSLVFPNEMRKCIRVWPHRHGLIGMTICLLRKTKR